MYQVTSHIILSVGPYIAFPNYDDDNMADVLRYLVIYTYDVPRRKDTL